MKGARLWAGVLGGCGVLLGALAPAADEPAIDPEAIDQAIARGVAFLKEKQAKDGSWGDAGLGGALNEQNYWTMGVTSLAGLALLECGVPVKDPAVQSAADFVRKGAENLTFTHSLGAAILFLDRVGKAEDEDLIKTLGARLLAGQQTDGGWGYHCYRLAVEDVRRLKPEQFLQGLQQLLKKPGKAPGGVIALGNVSTTENSCSEFAVMGLWVARRYNVPVGKALGTFEKSCRTWQNADGSFPYSPRTVGGHTACMTGAGLIGLAYCNGSANEAALLKYAKSKDAPKPAPGKGLRDPNTDPVLRKGLAFLEGRIKGGNLIPKGVKLPPGMKAPAQEGIWPGESFGYMSLWTLERVAVTYNLEKVGKTDWYAWGARRLLKEQQKDGSWRGDPRDTSSGPLYTAFALLFLRKSQPSPDLSLLLRGVLPPPRGSTASESQKEK